MLSIQKSKLNDEPKISEKKEQQQTQQHNTINIVNVATLDNNNLLVEHNHDTYTFTIKNRDNIIGTFTCGQIFKYLNQDIDNFLLDITLGTSLDIITKYLCKLNDDEIILISHTESPITGNIDILVKLYKDLYEYEQNKITIELEKINEEIREQTRFKNREFIYTILLQIIKLFSSYTSSNVNINQQVKDLIMKYTIGAVYKISVMVKDDVDYNLTYIKNLTVDMENLNKIRNNMQLQINNFKEALEIENSKIDNIIFNMTTTQMKYDQIGGNKNTTTSLSTSTTQTTNNIENSDSNISSVSSVSSENNYSHTPTNSSVRSNNISRAISKSFLSDNLSSISKIYK